MVCGQPHLNPWTWRVRDVAVFLASYMPPVQDNALLVAGVANGNVVARSSNEVFSFSPGRAADPMLAGTRLPAPPAPRSLQHAASQEVFSFRSNAPPVAASDGSRRSVGAAAAGPRITAAIVSLPQPRAATFGDVIGSSVSEDSGRLELAALEAYEATAAVMGSGSAAEPVPLSALPLVQQPQLNQPQQQAAPHECRSRQHLAPRAAAEVIDLTLSDDDSSPPWHGFGALDVVQQRQQQQQIKTDPSGSPSQRRGDGSVQGSPAKRAKPSHDSAQAGAAAAQSARGSRGTVKLQQHLVCSICQDLVVAAHSMVPCGHQFCAECLSGWLATKRVGSADCPMCRARAEAPPVRAITIDNIVADLLHELPADEQEAYNEKKMAWEARREDIEQGLRAPWAASSRPSSSGARRRPRIIPTAADIADPDPNGLLRAALTTFLGGPALYPAPGYVSSGGTNRGYAVTPPAVYSYRVEYANRGAGPCTACSGAIDENMLRIGTRPQTHGRAAAWRWFHIHW